MAKQKFYIAIELSSSGEKSSHKIEIFSKVCRADMKKDESIALALKRTYLEAVKHYQKYGLCVKFLGRLTEDTYFKLMLKIHPETVFAMKGYHIARLIGEKYELNKNGKRKASPSQTCAIMMCIESGVSDEQLDFIAARSVNLKLETGDITDGAFNEDDANNLNGAEIEYEFVPPEAFLSNLLQPTCSHKISLVQVKCDNRDFEGE